MNTYYALFADAMIAAANSSEMKAPFNNNLPSQTKGVMVNPENPVNPDSKPGCWINYQLSSWLNSYIIKNNLSLKKANFFQVLRSFLHFLVIFVLNQDLQDLQDCR